MELLFIDSQTWVITIAGWFIVFVALLLLILVFTLVPKILKNNLKNRMLKEGKMKPGVEYDDKDISGDESAAISAAIHLFFDEMHDEESNVITIKRIRRRYSPWSSKIYGLRNFPN